MKSRFVAIISIALAVTAAMTVAQTPIQPPVGVAGLCSSPQPMLTSPRNGMRRRSRFGRSEISRITAARTPTRFDSLLNGTCALQLFCQTDAAGAPGGHEHILPAKQSSSQANSHDTDPGQDRAEEVIIAGGDLLEINLFGTDFSCGHEKGGCEARVSASGNIVLPLIGSVKLAGLTVAEAEQVIAVRLSQGDFYNDPQVTIAQKEYASQGISVGGEVQKPGIYSLLGPHTLPQAILAAGGTTVKAGNDVTIVRHGTSQHIDLKSPSSSSIRLAPGDTIVVSKAGIVYVVGDVHQPAGIVMDSSGLTVLQAIAMAQGTNSTASSHWRGRQRRSLANPCGTGSIRTVHN